MAQNNYGDESDAMIDDTIENRNDFDEWLRESLFTADDRFRQKSAVIRTIFFEFVCTLFATTIATMMLTLGLTMDCKSEQIQLLHLIDLIFGFR